MLARQAAIIRVVAHRVVNLGSKHKPLTRAHLQQVTADDLLVTAEGIPVRHVEESDAVFERSTQDWNRSILIEYPSLPGRVAHRHRAEAQLRYFQTCPPESDVIHARPTHVVAEVN